MGIQMGVGFGPGGAGIAAQAMQNQALEKKKKLDAEAKDRVSKISQLVTAVVMQGGKIGIDPMLNIQSGEPTGDANLDKMLPMVRDELSKLPPYEQELAKKTGYAVAATVGKKFIAEQTRQQGDVLTGLSEFGKRGVNYPVTQENFQTLGQMGYNPLMQDQSIPQVGMTNAQQGGIPYGQTVIPPPPQPPGTQTFYERDPEAWRQQQETQAQIGVKYRQPTTPEKPLRQLVPVQNADGTTTYKQVGEGTTIPTQKPPLKTIPTEQVKGLKTFDDLATLAESLKGIGTKYAGPVKGRLRLYSSKVFADPEFVKAKTNLAKLMPIVYALSGKQINEWEMKWLKEDILPNLTSPGANFEATLDEFIKWTNTKSSSLKEGYKQAGYNLPENKPDPLGIR